MTPAERERLRAEYRRRDQDTRLRDRYAPDDPSVRLAQRDLERRIASLLAEAGWLPAPGWRVLEVGCGSGGLLLRLARLGRGVALLGLDLSAERLAAARHQAAPLELVQGDAAALPFPDAAVDLVVQSTLISSVLDRAARGAVAAEMARVLRPGGRVLWYDFIWNPLNPATRGVGRRELLALFPGFRGRLERVTLAPPLARPLARRSPRLAAALARVPLLCSHYLALLGRGP